MKAFAFLIGVFVTIPGLLAATAGSGLNPYQLISDRNPFGLRPPLPNGPPEPPKPVASKIKLQGITSILGRKQVLFNINIPARAPEPARDASYVLGEGQREGEVEVVEIDDKAGIIKFNNAGAIEVLSMDKDAEKPAAGPAAPGPGVPPPGVMPRLPGVPPSAPPVAPAASSAMGGASVTTFGGGADQRTIPTRTLRTQTAGGANSAQTAGFGGFGGTAASGTAAGSTASSTTPLPTLTREEQAALMLLNKEKWKQQGREDIANLIPNPIPPQSQSATK